MLVPKGAVPVPHKAACATALQIEGGNDSPLDLTHSTDSETDDSSMLTVSAPQNESMLYHYLQLRTSTTGDQSIS